MSRPISSQVNESVAGHIIQKNVQYNQNPQFTTQMMMPNSNIGSKTNSVLTYNSGFHSFIPDHYQYAINQNRANELRQ